MKEEVSLISLFYYHKWLHNQFCKNYKSKGAGQLSIKQVNKGENKLYIFKAMA